MVTCLPMVSCKDGVCSRCVLEKHYQDNFAKYTSWHALTPLQLVHGDICGPLPISSFFGLNYFLTFIDDYCRCTRLYFLKIKSEVFGMFLTFKSLVDK